MLAMTPLSLSRCSSVFYSFSLKPEKRAFGVQAGAPSSFFIPVKVAYNEFLFVVGDSSFRTVGGVFLVFVSCNPHSVTFFGLMDRGSRRLRLFFSLSSGVTSLLFDEVSFWTGLLIVCAGSSVLVPTVSAKASLFFLKFIFPFSLFSLLVP